MKYKMSKVVCLSLAAALTSSTFASGFQLTEMSAKKLGQANAGAAAYGDDASTIFWNPAGLRKITDRHVTANASIISINPEFKRTLALDALGNPLAGNDGGDIAEPAAVPATFYASPGESLSWGIGIHAPFGLTTEYDADSIFRYQGLRSEVTVIDINPAIAWSAGKFHMGIGADIQYMNVLLSNSVDYGAACFGAVSALNPALIPSLCVGNGLIPQQADGRATIEGDNWAVGVNLGIMYDASEHVTLGLSHRSQVSHRLEGDATFTNAPAFFIAQGLFSPSDIEAEFESPSLTMLSSKWDVNPSWTLAADISYSSWSNFAELDVKYLDTNQPNTTEAFDWKDVYRYSLGVEHAYSDRWTFRTGVAYDKSPIREEERSVRLPSSNRTWLSVGASYTLNSGSSIDLAFVHLFIDDPIELNRTGPLGDTLIGAYTASADILSFQYNHKFH